MSSFAKAPAAHARAERRKKTHWLNNELRAIFFGIANHKLVVVGIDASYTKPYTTDIVFVTLDQTHNLLVTVDRPPSRYYITAHAYASANCLADSSAPLLPRLQ
ncbi:hypothetical protein Scep_001159 [Stephania cephalantha]|uniref:Plastocyanin-like domain-containing protein n=1 Tax=Stephania cephalantha TaxID=152367 RepID=A0AAP0Q3P5_9MAGN